jgi:hypothetical protein
MSAFFELDMDSGIANLELQLSKEPVIGKWAIEATIEVNVLTMLSSGV